MPGVRYRAPQAPSTAIITRDGYERLRAELDELWQRKRPEVVTALSAAAAEGDRSENAEYTYRKKQLGEIDRRVRYLSKLLKRVEVVQEKPHDQSRIFFGAAVALEEDQAEGMQANEVRYRIVGPDETDAQLGWISIDSPLARAMLKKTVDDEIVVDTPGGKRRFYVLEVSYP
jgi:transcription elongation factor GreB